MNLEVSDVFEGIPYTIRFTPEEAKELNAFYAVGLTPLDVRLKRNIRGVAFASTRGTYELMVQIKYKSDTPKTRKRILTAVENWFAEGRVLLKCKEAISK